ncbi:transcriptional regulator, XRE family [Xylanimonas cellulosilytica DSM 15894]|uniref:Transcriptional regulator, XRE family n=1 Tax=Xylanimonas cellulosilytica (strain DSM 15894 / JCM 12276 / CECT 5975 / KCTC 9989 / LMG 20990 / NBRC 107835 / XIL07) TaxID=446471 RepID=D1C0F1_XYLCX|nr:helix-turn-helix domain-containing protein [Xylanimonas cellulosilytica]ACZ32154.1 transcriptional regulator, XRE family [Xylanimonas cellulosilytica DSM 15894]
MDDADNRLGATLRAWRDRLSPEVAGLPGRAARRSPGLRREDVAELAGISVDYVVRLEQGRASAPSDQVVAALARALRLDVDERGHLYRLAGLRPPSEGPFPDRLPPGMARLLARLADVPVAVFAADWTLVWWNPHWAALFGDPTRFSPDARNLVRLRFPVAEDRGRLTSWPVIPADAEAADRALVADLRQASGRYPDDPRLTALVTRTLAGNTRFAKFWTEGTVGRHAEDRKLVRHPDVGDITVDCDVLTDEGTDLKVVAYTAAPGSEDETRLRTVAGLAAQPDPVPTGL